MAESLGVCPFCSAQLLDRKVGGGIWTGSLSAKAANGPLLFKTCESCGRKLYAAPTHAEFDARQFEWREEEEEFPGEEFVATMARDDSPDFLDRISRFVAELKSCGFEARCPDYTFAGILVRSAEAARAREILNNRQIGYLRVWVCDAGGRPAKYIGSP